MLPQINLAACWLLLVSYALLYVCDTKMTLFFFPKWIFSLGKLPMQLVLSQTVQLSSQICYILDPCWEFMGDSKVCGEVISEVRLCYFLGAPPHSHF